MPTTMSVSITSSIVSVTEAYDDFQIIANDGPNDALVSVGAPSVVPATLVKVGAIVKFGTSLGMNAFVAAVTTSGTASLRISSPGPGGPILLPVSEAGLSGQAAVVGRSGARLGGGGSFAAVPS